MGEYGITEYYAQKYQEGLEFQDFISDRLRVEGFNIGVYSSLKYQLNKGESASGIEIKFDGRFRETGNFYIEVAEKSHPNVAEFSASGILRSDNAWGYLIGDYQDAYLFSVLQLRNVYSRPTEWKQQMGIKNTEIKTSRGMLLPLKYALNSGLCIKHFDFNKSN